MNNNKMSLGVKVFALYSPACLFAPSVGASLFDDGKATVTARNFYYNQDFRSADPPQSKIEEWAQGFILRAESDYTDTVVGFGVDVYAGLGIKLDSSADRSGSGLLPGAFHRAGGPRSTHPESADEYSEATAALKIKYSKSEFKLGGLFPKIPLISASDGRLLPQFFQGAMLNVKDVEGFEIAAGQFNRANHREFTARQKIQAGNYLAYDSDYFTYAGVVWRPQGSISASVWSGELKDIYKQQLYSIVFSAKVSDWKLGTTLNYMPSQEAGKKLAGSIDSRVFSILVSVARGGSTVRLSLQDNGGGSATPYIYATDLSATPSFVQVLRFDRAGERSWQARYDYDFSALGVPGLQAMTRYVGGRDIQLSNGTGKEWERDIDLSYTIQSGKFKDVSVRLRNAEFAGDVTGRRSENRLIVGYAFGF